MSLEIRHYKPNTGSGKALAYFTVYNKKTSEIKNFFSVIESNGKRWISPPSRKIEMSGEERFIPYALYEDKKIQEKFLVAIMQALEAYWDANPEHSPNMMIPAKDVSRDLEVPF